MKLVNLFVYGTLRPGGTLYDHWISEAVEEIYEIATTRGSLYHVHSGPGFLYPVAKLDEKGLVRGTVLRCRAGSPALAETIRMETNAGYEVWLVEVNVLGLGMFPCKSFHYPHSPKGKKIVSGDWLAEVKRMGG